MLSDVRVPTAADPNPRSSRSDGNTDEPWEVEVYEKFVFQQYQFSV